MLATSSTLRQTNHYLISMHGMSAIQQQLDDVRNTTSTFSLGHSHIGLSNLVPAKENPQPMFDRHQNLLQTHCGNVFGEFLALLLA